jgi:hypothetical protein
METTKCEMDAVLEVATRHVELEIQELSEARLASIGGGVADVHFF